ncbi:MAG: hypothetical protein ACI9Z4_002215, partial [Polaribacter sp.]
MINISKNKFKEYIITLELGKINCTMP